MNSPSFEGGKLASPQEELARIREAGLEHARNAAESGAETTPRQVITETVKAYADAPAKEVLRPDYELKPQEVEAITLELSPETHDKQMEELIGVVLEKGIKNAMTVAEGMNNPHLLDDFHRVLIQLVASGRPIQGLKEHDPLWKPLHMTLFEVSLPETSEADKQKELSALISGMEQFYSGMLSIPADRKDPAWFTVEIANRNGSEEFVFYVSVPTARRDLFEKHILAVFPGAHIHEHKDDYNIFNPQGAAAVSYARLAQHPLYPLRSYEDFDIDPLNSILNSFSKLDKHGEGAAIQLIVGAREDAYSKECAKAIEKIRKGEKVKDALKEVDRGLVGSIFKEAAGMFKKQETLDKEKEEKAKRAQAVDQTAVEQFTKKLSSPFVSVNLRVVASAATGARADVILHDIESGFNQFENGHGNRIEWAQVEKRKAQEVEEMFSLREYDDKEAVILNIEELTSCVHFPASTVSRAAPQLKQSKAGTSPAPLDVPKEGTLIGVNDHRGQESRIYIAPEDRMRHFYVIGQTGTGKTGLLKNMIIQDIRAGSGVCFIDPHGSDVQDILANVPQSRYEDVVYFDPASVERPMALNMLEYDRRFPEQKTFVVNEMFSIFQKLYGAVPESMGPMFEQYFRNATNLVIEDPDSGSTLLDVSRVMSNKAFRELKISKCKNPVVVQFWKEIAEKAGGEASLANIVPYITSKFDVFLSNEIMRPIVSQEKSSFNMREIMDGRKILLVNLSKGRLGDINSHLIGLILVGKILMAALSRVDSFGKGGTAMPDFYLYLDEFQNVTTDSIATILSEARKYRLALTVAHQFIGQLDDKIKNAVFGNVGSMAVFRVGTEDAEFLEKQFTPVFSQTDIANLDNFNAYIRLLADGRPTKPFNIRTMPPERGNPAQVDKLRELSALMYGRPRAEVEEEVMRKYQGIKA
ncbi:MAG: type IV secretory system conjugative DNA transfer family protein [Patescibacteria group bacterium]|nr:type IV secretory system conjugative DNA transfer family protein [Patescibacteria group bacterium]